MRWYEADVDVNQVNSIRSEAAMTEGERKRSVGSSLIKAHSARCWRELYEEGDKCWRTRVASHLSESVSKREENNTGKTRYLPRH